MVDLGRAGDLAMDVLPWIGVAAITYTLGYLFAPSKLDAPKDRAYYGSSVLALMHGIFVSILAMMAGLQAGFWTVTWEPWDYYAVTPATSRCIHVFLAFLLTDLMPLMYYRNVWSGVPMYIGHHSLSCVAWSDAAINGTCHNVALGLLLLEATSPFINGRYFLSTHGLKGSPLYLYNGVAMAVSFLALRVIGMGCLGMKLFYVDSATSSAVLGNKTYILIPIFIFGYGLQLTWFQKIISGLLAFLKKDTKKPESKKI
eukprot:CAMPEP_0119065952 /NCGR_PEP_ID=MMETSP1178-20130426/8631_1 /TAXON_ID=33656 /ORGANISM="unid sp, Strain CCMP2000" /LENGTH=256 /DNA_ID=CAMNT_0007047511 /DNA_START=44 /DNA_END=814 /DNA_ORIENTATION=-